MLKTFISLRKYLKFLTVTFKNNFLYFQKVKHIAEKYCFLTSELRKTLARDDSF